MSCMSQKMTYSRKAPQRTCVSCRRTMDKADLIRIVRQPNGLVCVDQRGRTNGRGAYVCSSPECWQACQSSSKLDYVLKVKLANEEKAQLMTECRKLVGGS